MTASQAGFRHKNRRTASRITTGRPPAGPSATVRTYPLCTRDDHAPQAGHAAPAARDRACITTPAPAGWTCSTYSPRR